jgi:hypothetical protein
MISEITSNRPGKITDLSEIPSNFQTGQSFSPSRKTPVSLFNLSW